MSTVSFTINGQNVKGKAGNTILEIAQKYKIQIPTLCHSSCLKPYGACRICIVEDMARGNLFASCVTPISEGMSVLTHSENVLQARKVIAKLAL